MSERNSITQEIISKHKKDNSLYSFANKLGVSMQLLYTWDTGKSVPSYEKIMELMSDPSNITAWDFANDLRAALYGGG